MAKVRKGKVNKNLNILVETAQRIGKLRRILLVSSTGNVVDIAIAKLFNEVDGNGKVIVIPSDGTVQVED